MASIRPISIGYSKKLDGMTDVIRQYIRTLDHDSDEVACVRRSIEDFCHNNSTSFRETFFKKCNVPVEKIDSAVPDLESAGVLRKFVNHLATLSGECVFLLKDTQAAMVQYQEKTGRGFGVTVNRAFLCDGDEDRYFLLVNLLYDALNRSDSFDDFLTQYQKGYRLLVNSDDRFYKKSLEVAQYVIGHTSSRPITWVDLGFQFTLSLFCYGAVHVHFGEVTQDFMNLSVYPWLRRQFQGKFFTPHSAHVLPLELESIRNYDEAIAKRSVGAMLGFAIGDSLGFPVAGLDRCDAERVFPSGIVGYAANPNHPMFDHLNAGQYTDNTRLLMLSARSLLRNRGLNVTALQSDLTAWAKEALSDPNADRWLGPTTAEALKRLVIGGDYRSSGSTTTVSCAATYRTLPLGVYYRPFDRATPEQLAEWSALSAMVTHNSSISIAGAIVTALVTSDLVVGVPPQHAVRAAVQSITRTESTEILLSRIIAAADHADDWDIGCARRNFGTGSPIYETLPLAIFCMLHYPGDFRASVFAAANSFREDSPDERLRLSSLSYTDQLRECIGGNTDGIAALTGAFMGSQMGVAAIPDDIATVEDAEALRDLGISLSQ